MRHTRSLLPNARQTGKFCGRQKAIRGGMLSPQPTLVFPCAPILGELDNEEGDGGEQNDMYQAALVKQKFLDEPNDEQKATGDPEHFGLLSF